MGTRTAEHKKTKSFLSENNMMIAFCTVMQCRQLFVIAPDRYFMGNIQNNVRGMLRL